jgi:ribosome biogenesis protein BMS1
VRSFLGCLLLCCGLLSIRFLSFVRVAAHSFPKVMGVLTHLDKFSDNKKLNQTKRRLKHRFWTEVADGAKLFYLSGLVNEKWYPKREVCTLLARGHLLTSFFDRRF